MFNKKVNEKLTYIFISAFIFSLILMLICGLIVVERNTRYVAFGDTKPFLEYNIKGGGDKFVKIVFAGKDLRINIRK